MNNNILTLIHFDVCFTLQKLQKQVKEKKLKILLIRSNRKLFNVDKLTKYLSEVPIQNTFILKDIIGKIIKIIDINNNDFQELERLESDNSVDFGFSTPVGGGGFFSTSTPFECITIENKEIFYTINSESDYKDFFEQGNFDIFRSQDFAQKCARLLNLITAAYPNLKQEENKNGALKTFECKLTDEQIKKIFDLVKEIKLFEDPFDLMDLKSLFYCSTNKPLKVKNNQNLAWLFNYLQPEFITTKWQSIIDNNKCLIGNKGAFLTAKNLSASLSSASKNSEVSNKITTVITKLNTPN